MLNGLVAYYRGFNTAATKTLAGKVIGLGENKGFDSTKLKLTTAGGALTNVAAAKFTLTPVTANTALYGGTWAT